MIVWSMGRVGSHAVRDWLRLNGYPEALVLHNVCWDDGHLLPDIPQFDPTRPPEGLGETRTEWARRLREETGVEVVVPVRDPVRRAVSAWTEFRRRRIPIGACCHEYSADGWWARQVERIQGTPLPTEPGWWPGRHRVLLYRVEDGNLGLYLGREGGVPWKEKTPMETLAREIPGFPEVVERIRRGRTARHFYRPSV